MMENKPNSRLSKFPLVQLTYTGVLVAVIFGVLFEINRYSHLLFHSIAEIIRITVATIVFIIAWNCSRFLKNQYLLVVGIAYLFVGGLDLLHTLSYRGIDIFSDYDYYTNQLWIAARFLESVTLLIGFFFLSRGSYLNKLLIFIYYLFFFSLVVCSIFIWKIFPECYVEGIGQTPFNVYSEYAICIITLSSCFLLFKSRDRFEKYIFQLILWAFIFITVSELWVTLPISNYELSHMFGHFTKLVSIYLIYKAFVETGLNQPYRLIFRELSNSNALLEKQTAELKLLNQNKDKFLSVIAHDLKNNIGALSGLSDFMLENSKTWPRKKIREVTEVMKLSAVVLINLLENLLQWAQIQTGTIKSEPTEVNINHVIAKAIGIVNATACNKKIRIINSVGDSPVMIDITMMTSVIQNILSNAIKFSYEEGVIRISSNLCEDKIEILFADHGIGIRKETLEKLLCFEHRETSVGTSGEKGSGLGLVLCNEFVRLSRGKLSVASQLGKGTTVTITLPLTARSLPSE